MAATAALNSNLGFMVRGVEVVRCDDMRFTVVDVTQLESNEGGVVAFDITGDGNDRTDHEDAVGISFRQVNVDKLSGPMGAGAFKSSATPLSTPAGITVGLPEESDRSLGNPRLVLNYQMTNARTPRPTGQELPVLTFTNEQVLIDILRITTLDTPEKIIAFRNRVLAFYEEHYGMRFYKDVHDIDVNQILSPITVLDKDGNPTDSVVQLGQLSLDTDYHATSICVSNGAADKEAALMQHRLSSMTLPSTSSQDRRVIPSMEPSGATMASTALKITLFGWAFTALSELSLKECKKETTCRWSTMASAQLRPKLSGGRVSFYINCAVESDQFGKGMATGSYIFYPSEDGT